VWRRCFATAYRRRDCVRGHEGHQDGAESSGLLDRGRLAVGSAFCAGTFGATKGLWLCPFMVDKEAVKTLGGGANSKTKRLSP
jgi:hypothetical protein